MNRKNEVSNIVAAITAIVFLLFIALIMDACTPKCIKYGCDNDQAEGSSYCYLHKLYSGSSSYKSNWSSYSSESSSSESSSSNSKLPASNKSPANSNSGKNNYSSNPYSSYDEGYEDVYDDDDYDWDRYWSDDEYADGVDDAMEDEDW